MENTVVSRVDQPKVPAISRRHFRRRLLFGLVGAHLCPWRARCVRRAAGGAAARTTDRPLGPPQPVSPWISTVPPLREFVLSADLRLIVGMQAWIWAGFGFLTLYIYGVLPGIFAWPAGLGDMAIGVTAPLVLSALLRRPGFAARKSFVAWNFRAFWTLPWP